MKQSGVGDEQVWGLLWLIKHAIVFGWAISENTPRRTGGMPMQQLHVLCSLKFLLQKGKLFVCWYELLWNDIGIQVYDSLLVVLREELPIYIAVYTHFYCVEIRTHIRPLNSGFIQCLWITYSTSRRHENHVPLSLLIKNKQYGREIKTD